MKKLILFAAAFSLFACDKSTDLEPEVYPGPVIEEEVVDTTTHPLINEWTCYQYKYTSGTNQWVMQTAWVVKLEKDTFRIDEGRDGDFEKNYPVSLLSTPAGSVLTITYPTDIRNYEIRKKLVGQKKGYDLINDDGTSPDTYSLIK